MGGGMRGVHRAGAEGDINGTDLSSQLLMGLTQGGAYSLLYTAHFLLGAHLFACLRKGGKMMAPMETNIGWRIDLLPFCGQTSDKSNFKGKRFHSESRFESRFAGMPSIMGRRLSWQNLRQQVTENKPKTTGHRKQTTDL